MKKYDTSMTENEMYGEPQINLQSKKRIVRPTLDITLKQLPVLKNKDFNDKFTIEADVSVKSVSKTNERIRYELEIIKVGIKGGAASNENFDKLSDTEQKEQMKKSVKI